MIRCVKFISESGTTYNSWDDFNLIRTSKKIGTPSVKKTTVKIEGADGVIDLTDYFGETKYDNRKLSFTFSCKESIEAWDDIYSDIQNKIHGQKMKIILDEDSEFYYVGRVSLNEWKSSKTIGKITIDADCEPYKYKINETVVTNTVEESATLSFSNLRKSVCPTIKTSASVKVVFDDTTYTLDEGSYILPDVVFKAGTNTLYVTGTATITVTYREGGL